MKPQLGTGSVTPLATLENRAVLTAAAAAAASVLARHVSGELRRPHPLQQLGL